MHTLTANLHSRNDAFGATGSEAQGEALNNKTLQCVVVEIELSDPTHICGPDCPCWTVAKEERRRTDDVPQNVLVMPRIFA